MARKRYRDFPIVDSKGKFLGLISRRRLLNVRKKQVILVDHNEKNQAVDGVEEADVLEIIDHHRLSSIETHGTGIFPEPAGGLHGHDNLSDVSGGAGGSGSDQCGAAVRGDHLRQR